MVLGLGTDTADVRHAEQVEILVARALPDRGRGASCAEQFGDAHARTLAEPCSIRQGHGEQVAHADVGFPAPRSAARRTWSRDEAQIG
jgi:hypothetical protein